MLSNVPTPACAFLGLALCLGSACRRDGGRERVGDMHVSGLSVVYSRGVDVFEN